MFYYHSTNFENSDSLLRGMGHVAVVMLCTDSSEAACMSFIDKFQRHVYLRRYKMSYLEG